MSRQRMILASHADAVRVALLAGTCGWAASDAGYGESSWRTPGGLRVLVRDDPLLGQPVLELAASGGSSRAEAARAEAARAEAAELTDALPRLVSVVRFTDALDAFARTASTEQRAATLPPLAATLPDGDAVNRARVIRAAYDATGCPAGQARAAGVLAAAYLSDEPLADRIRALAYGDQDPRVRAIAARVAVYRDEPTQPALVRRVAFTAERVAAEFTAFAAELGWQPLVREPARLAWQAGPDVQAILVSDSRLGRDCLTVRGLTASAADRAERAVKNRFPTVELQDVLSMMTTETDDGARLLLLRVLAAAAPPRCEPRLLAVLAGLFRDPVTPVRGFAVGASIYYPWPELEPLLAWSAGQDPDATIRGLARIGLAAIRRAPHENGSTDHA